MNERKCVKCKNWVEGSLEVCPNCNTEFYAEEKKQFEVAKKKAFSSVEIPLIEIHETDPILIKVFKKIIRFHQMVFIFFVTVIGYIAASVVG